MVCWLLRYKAVLAADNIGCGNFVHGLVPQHTTHATLKAINMFVYKENNDISTRGIRGRRRGTGRSDSLQLEGDNETSDIKGREQKGHLQNTTSSNSSNVKLGLPTFDVKIIGGKRVVIYHDQLPENKKK